MVVLSTRIFESIMKPNGQHSNQVRIRLCVEKQNGLSLNSGWIFFFQKELLCLVLFVCIFIRFIPAMPMGQMPVLEVDGHRVHQSISMARYVAKRVGLAGSNDWENLVIDTAVDTVNDFRLSKLFSLNLFRNKRSLNIQPKNHENSTKPKICL